ncbi:MAG: hypothetical protein HRU19_14525 [Pseudobacteriovorax sp.]|nr:hypothetical protein [Pseudobacteriovorax sp.]
MKRTSLFISSFLIFQLTTSSCKHRQVPVESTTTKSVIKAAHANYEANKLREAAKKLREAARGEGYVKIREKLNQAARDFDKDASAREDLRFHENMKTLGLAGIALVPAIGKVSAGVTIMADEWAAYWDVMQKVKHPDKNVSNALNIDGYINELQSTRSSGSKKNTEWTDREKREVKIAIARENNTKDGHRDGPGGGGMVALQGLSLVNKTEAHCPITGVLGQLTGVINNEFPQLKGDQITNMYLFRCQLYMKDVVGDENEVTYLFLSLLSDLDTTYSLLVGQRMSKRDFLGLTDDLLKSNLTSNQIMNMVRDIAEQAQKRRAASLLSTVLFFR